MACTIKDATFQLKLSDLPNLCIEFVDLDWLWESMGLPKYIYLFIHDTCRCVVNLMTKETLHGFPSVCLDIIHLAMDPIPSQHVHYSVLLHHAVSNSCHLHIENPLCLPCSHFVLETHIRWNLVLASPSNQDEVPVQGYAHWKINYTLIVCCYSCLSFVLKIVKTPIGPTLSKTDDHHIGWSQPFLK